MIRNLWKNPAIMGKDTLDCLVYRSRLIGIDPKLCLWGGGNTSTKTVEKDFFGNPVKILWVKGSGSDMKSCERKHFTPLDLEKLLHLLKRDRMSDEEMVDLLAQAILKPNSPRPSIEALLHAFVPFSDIDHSHADAILSVTNNTRNRGIARKLYGNELLWIPYVKPGFELSKRVYAAFRGNSYAKGAILEKHGLITWGNDSKTSYARMVEMVNRAEKYIAARSKKKCVFGGARFKNLNPSEKKTRLVQLLPAIRRAVSKQKRAILTFVDSPAVMEFINSKKGARISQIGPATPDHMLRTKHNPLFVKLRNGIGSLGATELVRQIDNYAKEHERYFNRFKSPGAFILDPFPRVILIPKIGMIVTGKDLGNARECAEIYEHSIAAMRGGEATGKYQSLPLAKQFEMEYWPLELYKLSLAPPEKALARKIAFVTGAAGAIGRAISKKLAAEGAQVVLTDLDGEKAEQAAWNINRELKSERAIGMRVDVTREESVQAAVENTVLKFGGLDIVVSNAGIAHISSIDRMHLSDWEKSLKVNATGHFLIARETMKIFKRQELGGNFIFIATKNVLAPGKDFGAYSASKSAEAQLAKILAIEGGEFGVRANIVNPDGVFGGSGLWSKEVRKKRAKSYHISENELEDFYQERNLLKTKIFPEDVANSVFFLASDLSSKTTGCTLTVDGGVREAFPR